MLVGKCQSKPKTSKLHKLKSIQEHIQTLRGSNLEHIQTSNIFSTRGATDSAPTVPSTSPRTQTHKFMKHPTGNNPLEETITGNKKTLENPKLPLLVANRQHLSILSLATGR